MSYFCLQSIFNRKKQADHKDSSDQSLNQITLKFNVSYYNQTRAVLASGPFGKRLHLPRSFLSVNTEFEINNQADLDEAIQFVDKNMEKIKQEQTSAIAKKLFWKLGAQGSIHLSGTMNQETYNENVTLFNLKDILQKIKQPSIHQVPVLTK